MTLHRHESKAGVRALHDRLSEYLERVDGGGEVVVEGTVMVKGIGRKPGLAAPEYGHWLVDHVEYPI